mgnify:CR=1 FL=1
MTAHAWTNHEIKVFGGNQKRPNIHIADMTDLYVQCLQWEDKVIDGLLSDAAMKPWESFAKRTRLMKPHQLSDELERYTHDFSVVGGGAWVQLFDETMAALSFDIDGKELSNAEVFNLLADPDRAVAARYDAKQALLGTKRSTFVIDAEGVIRFRHDATLGLTYLPADDLRAAIAASQPSS